MADPSRPHVLIAGVTARAFAVSAARAGYRVTAIDAFGDLDLRAAAEVLLARPPYQGAIYGPMQAAATGDSVPAKLVGYTSNFENYPAAVQRLGRGRRLLGNTPETLTRVRNPFELSRALRRYGLAVPESRSRAPGAGSRSHWLLKPRRSGGGHGIVRWTPGQVVSRSMYLQQEITGIPGSITFVADGSTAVVLGFSRQLVGDARFGSAGFRYCGSLLGNAGATLFPRQPELLESAGQAAAAVTREFGLVGLNGLDFVTRHGVPYPLEINPRFSASMELIERAHGTSMFQVHAEACEGRLPSAPSTPVPVHGKAVIFSRRGTQIPTSKIWMRRGWMADIPHPGERIEPGRPICTIFAAASSPERCRRLLWRRAASVYRILEGRVRRAA